MKCRIRKTVGIFALAGIAALSPALCVGQAIAGQAGDSAVSPAAPASTAGTLLLKGLAGHEPITLGLPAFKAMPHVAVTVHNPHSNADESYSGVALIELLAKVGAPRGKELHGKGLSDYVVGTGSDGYKAVLALAEIDPEFHPGSVIVADQMDGKPLDAKSGPFKLVVSEDKRPARSVRNLVSVEVRAAE